MQDAVVLYIGCQRESETARTLKIKQRRKSKEPD